MQSNGLLAIPKYPEGKATWDFGKAMVKLFGPRKEQEIVALAWLAVGVNGLFWFWLLGF